MRAKYIGQIMCRCARHIPYNIAPVQSKLGCSESAKCLLVPNDLTTWHYWWGIHSHSYYLRVIVIFWFDYSYLTALPAGVRLLNESDSSCLYDYIKISIKLWIWQYWLGCYNNQLISLRHMFLIIDFTEVCKPAKQTPYEHKLQVHSWGWLYYDHCLCAVV